MILLLLAELPVPPDPDSGITTGGILAVYLIIGLIGFVVGGGAAYLLFKALGKLFFRHSRFDGQFKV